MPSTVSTARAILFLARFMLAAAMVLAAAGAMAQGQPRRMALVLGNDAYQNVTKLQKAGNDATAMARELKSAGFQVTLAKDVNYRAMVRAVETFTASLKGGDQVVVFYAGHGVQVRSGSYLLPVDIEAASESEIEKTAYGLADLTDKLAEAKPAFTLVLVDACRDNPLKSNGRSIGGTRGLSAVEPPKGQMVVYSASRGQQALDSLNDRDRNPNGVFTREFITRMRQPGVRIEEVVRQVQDSVETLARTVGHDQRPAIYNEARGNFYFFAPAAGQPAATVAIAPATAAPPAQPAPPARAAEPASDLAQAAANGDVAAMLALGDQAASQAEADGWYQKAAAAGSVAASFKLGPLAKGRHPADVAVVSDILARLPGDNERKVNITGFEAVKAFVASDPFFAVPGGSEKLSFDHTATDLRVTFSKTCARAGQVFALSQVVDGGQSTTEGSTLLGGLVNFDVASSARGYSGKAASQVTRIDSVQGQPFPLTPGKVFSLAYTTTRTDGVGRLFGSDVSQATWLMTCGVTTARVKNPAQAPVPEGATQLACLTVARGAKGLWQPIRRLYWHEASGCLVDTQ
ncbi:caspase family protein [Variovorax terrae]|uniref:Caspase family protein n=1 Tax=Variovorax terrae TaxID=2923278 RepID=A0A9X2AM45_9BURK|nr:caspase family protein [Variovorax terrae]MCJ0762904.1 caspase family protein [Variovorax terrae]